MAAVRPLQVKELAEVLAFDFDADAIPKLNPGWRWDDQEEALMSTCSSLVTIVKNGNSCVVQFSHFSVKEFLTSNRLADPIRDVSCYHVRLEDAHMILARTCLGVLLRLDDRIDRDGIEGFPLARYAAQYLDDHARFENVSSRIEDGMKCLFDVDKPHFATWLWIFREDWDADSMSTMCPGKPDATPLYYAAKLGFRDLAEHLISEHPEYVNTRGVAEETPIHAAANAGHVDLLSLLLEHGADADDRDLIDHTPLHVASWSGKIDAGQFLLDRGADIHARDSEDWTALHLAALRGHVEFAQMLLERGAVVDARCDQGRTSLYRAVNGDNVQLVRLLLEHGADANARDKNGWTPSRLGSMLGQPEIVELLTGADPVT